MTEEKKRTPKERLFRRNEIVNIVGVIALVLGALIMILGVMKFGAYQDLKDPTHFTDPEIKYKDVQNATFTWTRAQLNDLGVNYLYLMVAGGAILAFGYGIAFAVPEKKVLHQAHCGGSTGENYCPECGVKQKYCPECGLQLSKLEEKK